MCVIFMSALESEISNKDTEVSGLNLIQYIILKTSDILFKILVFIICILVK